MTKIQFSNRPNQEIKLDDQRSIWHGRSCAVVAHINLYNTQDKTWYVLLGQRGSGTPDFQGYWCLPCGYLDWDETLTQGMLREVWEECGLYLPALKEDKRFIWSENTCIHDGLEAQETPWKISDRPKGQKQNISMHYAITFSWNAEELPLLSDDNSEPNEVADIAWVPIKEVPSMELAFNHNACIEELREQKPELFKKVETNSQ